LRLLALSLGVGLSKVQQLRSLWLLAASLPAPLREQVPDGAESKAARHFHAELLNF